MEIPVACSCVIRIKKEQVKDLPPVYRYSDDITSYSYSYTVTRVFCEEHRLTTKLNCQCTTSLHSDTLIIKRDSQYCSIDIPLEGHSWSGLQFYRSCGAVVDVASIMRTLMNGSIYGGMEYELCSTVKNNCGCAFTPKEFKYTTETSNGVWKTGDALGVISFDESYPNSLLHLFARQCKSVYDQTIAKETEKSREPTVSQSRTKRGKK